MRLSRTPLALGLLAVVGVVADATLAHADRSVRDRARQPGLDARRVITPATVKGMAVRAR